eukprot:TRINITY_DN22624_c0_g1_i1.p1 TRINITY_DN22624_c0_g1~~TRINITY_DN22624_c0_g1_i1.p1  ORF type:complete len:504 (-),score=54.04 TRINITY_DN22624_c0_g1_i1:292-1803(-)
MASGLSAFMGLRSVGASASRSWYDHVIVGASAAGSVLANRLAAEGSKVLLLDAAPAPTPIHRVQAAVLDRVWGRRVGPSPGKVWARGRDSDYDSWASAAGDRNWRFARLCSQFSCMESEVPAPGGEVNISKSARSFVRACTSLGFANDVGFAVGDEASGVGYFRTLAGRDGKCWTREAYLAPAIEASGADGQQLAVLFGTRVSRIILQNRRATGVEWCGGRAMAGEVVLCAGAIGTPHVLLSSGIGPSSHLTSCGVGVTVDLPGVGANLQSQVGLKLSASSPLEKSSTQERRGYVAGGYIRSDSAACEEDLRVEFDEAAIMPADPPCVRLWLTSPRSRGKVELNAVDRTLRPRVSFDPLMDSRDRQALTSGVKRGSEVLSAAGLTAGSSTHDAKGNDVLTGRPIGTCAMGTGEMAVVDGELRVHGLQGLRVADASVMPSLVASDSHQSEVLIAEKTAPMLTSCMDSYHRSQYGCPPVDVGLSANVSQDGLGFGVHEQAGLVCH